MKFFKKITTFFLSVLFVLSFASCTTNKNPVVCFNLSDGKKITCELYPDVAPISVENFLFLAESGYYDGTVFHRVIENFMIQGGFYTVENRVIYPGKSAATIKGEFSANGVENNLKHTAGVLSMARALDNDSASSQFFICSADCPSLDGNYAAFGKVIDETSLSNVIALSKAKTCIVDSTLMDFPVEPVSILSIDITK